MVALDVGLRIDVDFVHQKVGVARQIPESELVQRVLHDLARPIVHLQRALDVTLVLEAGEPCLDAHHVAATLGDERLEPRDRVGVGDAVAET